MPSIPASAPISVDEIPAYLGAFTSYETQKQLPADRRALGPERARALLETLGLLPPRMPVIQVAGSKGKGSTVLWMEALLMSRGMRPGCYLSPHLVRINERVRIGGQDIDDSDLLDSLAFVHSAFEMNDQLRSDLLPTFFDLWTAVAVASFHRLDASHALVEVGLGGPLDSTSSVPHDVGVLTTLDLEHSRELGDTIEAIGNEKARIATRGRPFVTAETSVTSVVESRGARLVLVDDDPRIPQTLPAGQTKNLSTALCALSELGVEEFSTTEVTEVVKTTSLPGRLEEYGGLLLDSAHTQKSFREFVREFRRRQGGHGTILIALLEGKQWPAMLEEAHSQLPRVQWICTHAPSPRSESAEQVGEYLRGLGADATVVDDATMAIEGLRKRENAAVAGSSYLAGLVKQVW